MSAFSREAIRTRLRTLTGTVDTARVAVRHSLAGGPKPIRVLLVSDERAYTSEQQFAPMVRHAGALGRSLGVAIRRKPLAAGLEMPASEFASVDVLGLKLGFLTPPDEAVRIARHFRAAIAASSPSTKFVYFDGDDDVCVEWPGVLKAVDLYVKKHVFSDLRSYGRRYIGKSNVTDYVATTTGKSFADNVIPSSGPIDEADLAKLHLGWNIGLDDKIAKLSVDMKRADPDRMDIDIASRAFVKPEMWIYGLRAPVVDRLEAMSQRFRVLAPRDRVSQEQYYQEMLRARICVSPIGYGELCWRDFEAVLCGCLLVKPTMDHLRTYPDIFVPGETFAPVKWDYSDLEEVCARYLADEPARRKVADRAYAVLMDALGEASFVRTFGSLLDRLGMRVAG